MHSNEEKVGLGRFPRNVQEVSSVLLFNSTECPYQEYSNTDNLLGVDGNEALDEEDERRKCL